MHQHGAVKLIGLAGSLLTVMVITGLMLAATDQPTEFAGQVLSASGALVVGGEATDPGHPVVGATVHLVPTTAIDIATRMTASAIYAPPYPAELYDEPLEDIPNTLWNATYLFLASYEAIWRLDVRKLGWWVEARHLFDGFQVFDRRKDSPSARRG